MGIINSAELHLGSPVYMDSSYFCFICTSQVGAKHNSNGIFMLRGGASVTRTHTHSCIYKRSRSISPAKLIPIRHWKVGEFKLKLERPKLTDRKGNLQESATELTASTLNSVLLLLLMLACTYTEQLIWERIKDTFYSKRRRECHLWHSATILANSAWLTNEWQATFTAKLLGKYRESDVTPWCWT